MINSRGGGSNNPNQMHPQRQNMNHFQGQSQQQQQQLQRHHNPQQQQSQQQQSFNRNSSNAIPGQNRPQRPQQMPPNHHNHNSSNNSGQPIRTSSGQNQQHNNTNNNNNRPHSGMNNQNMMKPNSQLNNNNNSNNNNSSAQAVNNGPPLPIVLPKGWKREEIIRTKGISAGLVDVVYVPQPNSELCNSEIVGKKFRNKLELRKYFGTKYDTSLLDFKSGKVSQLAWRRQRRMKSIANTNNYASVAKYDTYLNVPVRQNTSVLKAGVSCITNNHKNEPTPPSVLNTTPAIGPNGQPMNRINEKSKPSQLFWELRFNDMKSINSELIDLENINDDFELENIPKFKNFPTSNETVLRSVAASWYLNQNKNLIGQEKEFTKNARIFIDREQPLIPQTSIKEDEIKQQEIKVKEMRKKLQLALDDLENIDRINKTDLKLVYEMENEDQVECQKDEIETKNIALIDQ